MVKTGRYNPCTCFYSFFTQKYSSALYNTYYFWVKKKETLC